MQWPPRPGPGIVGHEAERLGGGRADHLVDVDAHAVGDDLHLVDEADVDRAVDVFEQLGQLGGAGRAHRHHLVDRPGRRARAPTSRQAGVMPPQTFGIVLGA